MQLPRELPTEAQIALVKALGKVGAEWVTSFVTDVWDSANEKIRAELTAWLVRKERRPSRLLRVLAESVATAKGHMVISLFPIFLKQAEKEQWFYSVDTEAEVFENADLLVRASERSLQAKDHSVLSTATFRFVYLYVQATPDAAANPHLPGLLRSLIGVAEGKTRGKPSGLILSRMARLTSRQAKFGREVYDAPETVATTLGSVARLLQEQGVPCEIVPFGTEAPAEATSESRALSLLIAWDDFRRGSSSLDGLGPLIDALADASHIERLGAKGELVPFRVDLHELVEKPSDSSPQGKEVRVISPGYFRRRTDSSLVVLMKALVELPD